MHKQQYESSNSRLYLAVSVIILIIVILLSLFSCQNNRSDLDDAYGKTDIQYSDAPFNNVNFDNKINANAANQEKNKDSNNLKYSPLVKYNNSFESNSNNIIKEDYIICERCGNTYLSKYKECPNKSNHDNSFVVYSEPEKELTFYNREDIPKVGDYYNNKEVTQIYDGLQTGDYTSNNESPWQSITPEVEIINIEDEIRPASISYWFANSTNVDEIDVSNINTENLLNAQSAFENSGVESLYLTNFNMKNVVNTNSMFKNCSSLSIIYVSENWNLNEDIESNDMFEGCYNIIGGNGTKYGEANSISNVDTDTNKSYLTPYSNIKYYDEHGNIIQSVKFQKENQAINLNEEGFLGWSTNKEIIDFNSGDIIKYDSNNPFIEINLYPIFSPYQTFAVLSQSDRSLNFYNRRSIPEIGDKYDNIKVDKIYTDFIDKKPNNATEVAWNSNRYSFIYINFKDEIKPVSTAYWFSGFAGYGVDLSNLNTSITEDMKSMFKGSQVKVITGIGDNFNTSNVTDMSDMFSCIYLNRIEDVSKINTSNVVNMSRMFNGCPLTSLDLSNFDTSKVTDMGGMFDKCGGLKSITGIEDFDMSNVKNMRAMFMDCKALTELNLNNWNLSNVVDAGYMFYNNYNLSTLETSNWNMPKLQDAESLFFGCKELENIDTSNWNLISLNETNGMFSGCSKLKKIDISTWDLSKLQNTQAMFLGCTQLNSILAKEDQRITNYYISAYNMFSGCDSLVGGLGTTINDMNNDTSSVNSIKFARVDTLESKGLFSIKR